MCGEKQPFTPTFTLRVSSETKTQQQRLSVLGRVRLLRGTVALHLHLPPVVEVPAGRGLPLHLLQTHHGAPTAVTARTHGDLSQSGHRVRIRIIDNRNSRSEILIWIECQ